MYAPASRWTSAFLAISVAQTLVVLALQSYVFATFQIGLRDFDRQSELIGIIPTFLSLYIFAFLYQNILVYDALQQQNTIQILGLVIMNLGLLVYGVLQVDAVADGIQELANTNDVDAELWVYIRPSLVAIPCLLSFFTVLMSIVAWKLWNEFAWTILRLVAADLVMRQRYLNYQIYLTLLKFGFFYYLGFLVQYTVIIRGRTSTEFALTITCIPVTIILLRMAFYFTRHEIMAGMIAVVVLFLAEAAFFIFKLVRMFMPGYSLPYQAARKALTAFTTITIVVLLANMVYACLCMSAFGKGLKPFLKIRIGEEDLDHDNQYEHTEDHENGSQSGRHLEMMSNMRARLHGYKPAASR